MKTKLILTVTLLSAATLSAVAGVEVGISVGIPAPRVVYASPEVTVVPDSYVYDGYENVGVVNGAYLYLGPGNVWLPLPGDRLGRFHDWERGHANWRSHAIRNERYRGDRYRTDRSWNQERHEDHGHDRDYRR